MNEVLPPLPLAPVALERRACLLSNGHATAMLRADGSGYLRWRDLAVTRWRDDATRGDWGMQLLLRDEDDGAVWSVMRSADDDEAAVAFDGAAVAPPDADTEHGASADTAAMVASGVAHYSRHHRDIATRLDIAIAPDADIELRCLTLRNNGRQPRRLSLTSYAELVVGPVGADNGHPAFSKMFVQTEWAASQGVLLATRRRRAADDAVIWASQAMQLEGAGPATEHETDRARFLGRCRTLASARAMAPGATLSGTTGCVLDPVFSLRQAVNLAPGKSARVMVWTAMADTRDGALALANRQLADPQAAAALLADAAAHAASERSRLAITHDEVAQADDWLSALLVSDARCRPPAEVLARGHGGPPTLWPVGISGDRPIVLLQVHGPADLARVRELLLAQDLWRSQRYGVDVVLLNTASGAAGDVLHAALEPQAHAQQERLRADAHAVKVDVFTLRADAIADTVRDGLFTAARVVLGSHAPAEAVAVTIAARTAAAEPRRATRPAQPDAPDAETLEFANGHGGFIEQGRAYRIDLSEGLSTPMPWVNVIANPSFGCMVSAEGGGYAWSLNSQQNPITPWPNDPVSDTPHEVVYLRDADSGALWSATPQPIRVAGARYAATHGKGWSRYTSDAHGIALTLTVCVPLADTVKLSRLRLVNRSGETRRLSVTGYVEWALGANGTTPAPHVVTSRDERTGALFARNRWRPEFGDRVAFIDLGDASQPVSGDRSAFIGTHGSVARPAALQTGTPLAGRVGAALDACGAVQAVVELPPGTEIDLVFLLGDAADDAQAQALVETYRHTDIDAVLAAIATQWRGVLDTVQVRTPDRAMDVMLNHWLLYQVLACRVWARTAYYQASGAYGFRDQLQDVMALCASRPDLAREHVLRAVGRQFAEGDVQHWWLPPSGQGIRTKISDDRGWLVYLTMHYVRTTGDATVLDEALPFLTGPAIAVGAGDAFFQPGASAEAVSVYEHGARALDASLARGAHGLPLMQTGDWNDGMNSVGEEGRGESVWLGWLLVSAVAVFAPVAEQRGDAARAAAWRSFASTVRDALEQAWDGAWYRRGYYDDGTPLGSAASDECRIDTIAQSWSVISSVADPQRAAQAMASVDELLVDHDHGIARLFTPPFDSHSVKNPGYIKGYPPGVRENGGQYTHGATWSVFAWAGLGNGDKAAATFDMLNPIRHSDSADAVARYQVEPYAACADVYSVAPHVGRGGWTWYTGSAAWLYRAGLEAVLGFRLMGDSLQLSPCIPREWPGYQLTYRRPAWGGVITIYEIAVDNAAGVGRGVVRIELDGHALPADAPVPLADDGTTHTVRVVLG